jgi:predicted transglutaminase-like cysteine proteinase
LLALLLLFGLLCGEGSYTIDQAELADLQKRYGKSAAVRLEKLIETMNTYEKVSEIKKLLVINKFFNQVHFNSDMKVWKHEDYWATRSEFLGKGQGDCEDYSIAKYFTLIEMGVPSEKLYLTYVKAIELNQAHMVVTYFKDKKSPPLVLDNINKSILPATKRKDLVPVYSFNGEKLYLSKQRGLGNVVPSGMEQNTKWLELLKKIKRKSP